MREFHVKRSARDYYDFDQSLYSFSGNVIFANFHAARSFAGKMNAKRDVIHFPERAVQASQLNAMGLIDEILHLLVAEYRKQVNPNLLNETFAVLQESTGDGSLRDTLRRFSQTFPPLAVYRQETDLDTYLQGQTDGDTHWEIALEEMLMLWLANVNPAFAPYLELFDDTDLEKTTSYITIMAGLEGMLKKAEGLGSGGESLFDMLRAPALASPNSLAGQLEFIRRRWGRILPAEIFRLLSSLDFIAEEEKAVFFGPGPVEAIRFRDQPYDEPERYSPDTEWMPRLVLLAKNAYVWLDQLSKRYGRAITTLDQIPDEELDILANRGITGLWLIGLWERSKASKRIKQMMGNPEAEASAYSLYDYTIADDLGGQTAMEDLKRRGWQRGIRMSSDMVPNHMAIDSRWVIQHPNWFLSLDYAPFPSYSFNGPDLCEEERVGIFLEDHYYNHSDAAVVFKRVDYHTGDTRFIYHGNDGTMMPWNDTAQLDYLNAEVREAVIQTILHVARQFPIIRFDAAMTLAKKHIQRLWFPEPGTGGAIATRAEHGMTRERFDQAMPVEFWREVVDRVAEEVPDTLLLAEAFWLLEGYFVRTLGMHRVYNSAFMHMLRDEDNDKYRLLIKNTIEFDPEILKRYVNFMSNPDEETAVAQFEKGDKYFGVVTILATMPGLPMFGHGQFEGYAEKYGMEYRKAYWDEKPDYWLVERHMQEIVPLLRRRYLFAEVQNFLLYDFYTGNGSVDENVLAYSNRYGDERSLVIYHNTWADTRGHIHLSAAYLDKATNEMVQKPLAQGLQLPDDGNAFVLFRDYANDLEYIRNSKTLVNEGMYLELGAYRRHVFLDFRVVQDNEWRHYRQLTEYLNGRGVPSVEVAVRELFLQPLHQHYRTLVNAELFAWLMAARASSIPTDRTPVWDEEQLEMFETIEGHMLALLKEVQIFAGKTEKAMQAEKDIDVDILKRRLETLKAEQAEEPEPSTPVVADKPVSTMPDLETLAAATIEEIKAVLLLPVFDRRYAVPEAVSGDLQAILIDDAAVWGGLFAFTFTHALGRAVQTEDFAAQTRSWMDEWLLGKIITQTLMDMGLDDDSARRTTALTKLLITHQELLAADKVADNLATTPRSQRLHTLLETLLRDREVQNFLQINRYGGILWYNQEAFEILVQGMFTIAILFQTTSPEIEPEDVISNITELHEMVSALQEADKLAKYQVEKLLELVGQPANKA